MNLQVPHNLSSSERLIRTITSAKDKMKALNEVLGPSGSKKRKRFPKSLRKKIHEAVNPSYVPKQRRIDMLSTPLYFRFRDELRVIDFRNSFASLENERKALTMLDERVEHILAGEEINVKDEYRSLKQTFDNYGINLGEVLMDRYESLSYGTDQSECNKRIIYAKLSLFANSKFNSRGLDSGETEYEEVTNILQPLDGKEKRIFIETVLFDPSHDEEEEVGSFIQALKVAIDLSKDQKFKKEAADAVASVGGSFLEQVFELATFRITSTQEYAMSGLKHFTPGVTTRQIDPDKFRVEDSDDEDEEEDYWQDYEFYEDSRQEILMCAIEEGLIKPTQIEFEKLYEAAVYASIRNRIAKAMVDSIDKILKLNDVRKFLERQAENLIEEPQYDIWRRMDIVRQLARIVTPETIYTLERYLDHEDIYLTIQACRSLVNENLFKDKGMGFLASKIKKGVLKGDYKLLGMATLNCAYGSDDVTYPSQKLLGLVFAHADIDLQSAFKAMDGFELPFNENGYIRNEMFSKSTYDFISSIGLKLLAKWIINPSEPSQRANAIKVFQMFPLEERELFMTTEMGKRLLKKFGMQPM